MSKMNMTTEQIALEAAHQQAAAAEDEGGVYHPTRCNTGPKSRRIKPPETISRAGYIATRSSETGGLGSFHLSKAHVTLLAQTRRIERGPYLLNTNGEPLTDRKGRLILRANALKLLSKSANPLSRGKSSATRKKEANLRKVVPPPHA